MTVRAWHRFWATYEHIDRRVTQVLARVGIPALRISLGIVFLWFGALKLFPGLSPAQDLAAETIERLSLGVVPPDAALVGLAVWECAIGIGLLAGVLLRVTLFLLVVQMAGTITPLLLFPAETFTAVPYAPTLEGQYIIKNIVLVAAALVVGATVRGGGLTPEPPEGGLAPEPPETAPAPDRPQEGRPVPQSADVDLLGPIRALLRTRQTLTFAEAPVEPGLVDALADVARWSGSANNRQPWRFVVVRDPGTLARLARSGLPHTVTLATARAAIAFVLPDDPDRELVDAYDDGRAAERVLVGATQLGLGAAISWIRPDVLPVVRDILGLPDGRMVRTVMAIGHPAAEPGKPRNVEARGRLPRRETVHEERWRG